MYVSRFETISVKIIFNSGDFSDLDVAVDVIGSVGLLSCYKVLGTVCTGSNQAALWLQSEEWKFSSAQGSSESVSDPVEMMVSKSSSLSCSPFRLSIRYMTRSSSSMV